MQTSLSRCGQEGTTLWFHVYLRLATSCGLHTTPMITFILFYYEMLKYNNVEVSGLKFVEICRGACLLGISPHNMRTDAGKHK